MAGYIGSKTSVTVVSPETDSRYVNVTGDTMTGSLSVISNIGIGEPSPAWPLHITNATAPVIQLEETSVGNTFIGQDSDIFFIRRGSINNASVLAVDSTGRVTMPSQPIFMGIPTGDYPAGGYTAGVMDVTAIYDNGSNFNAANSRFTAPVNGWYRVTWGGLQLNQTVTSLMVNGVRTHNGNHVVFTGSYATLTQTVYKYLSAGDYLNIEAWNGGGWFKDWWIWTVDLTA